MLLLNILFIIIIISILIINIIISINITNKILGSLKNIFKLLYINLFEGCA